MTSIDRNIVITASANGGPSRRRAARGSALLALSGVLAAAGLLAGCAAHVSRIVLTNTAEGRITQVMLTWEGGSRTFDIVEPRASVTVEMPRVKTVGFDVELTFTDGKKIQKHIPSQFDPDYFGVVTLTVTNDGRVGWNEHFERR